MFDEAAARSFTSAAVIVQQDFGGGGALPPPSSLPALSLSPPAPAPAAVPAAAADAAGNAATATGAAALAADLVHVLFGASKDFCGSGLRIGALWSRNAALNTALDNLGYFARCV